MLKLKYLFVNFDLAKQCLALYDYDENSADKMMRYFRISSNAIYPFRCGTNPDEVHFLRLSPVEEKSFSDVVSEIHLIQWLIDNGYPAMKPVPMKNGMLADCIDTEWGQYNVSCFAEVPGNDLESINILDIVNGYGATLGKLHKIIRNYPYAEERRDHKAFMDEIHSRLVQYNAPECILAEFDAVQKELNQLPVNAEIYGVIHYDFESDNVLYDEDTKEFGVIDFDDAIRCWYALDVVRALDALDDVVDEDDLDEAEDKFIAGYRSECPLTEEQTASFPLMRRLVRLQEYSTLLHVMSEPVNDKPDWMIEVIEKLQYKLHRIEATIKQK